MRVSENVGALTAHPLTVFTFQINKMTLAELKIGQTATILNVGGEGGLRQHFLDMGVLPGVPVTLVKYAPMGDPMELRVHGYELTLRRADARKIEVRRTENGKRETENGKLIANPLAAHRSSAHRSPLIYTSTWPAPSFSIAFGMLDCISPISTFSIV